MNPIKLILASLFVLLAGCGESADLQKSAKDSNHATEKSEPAGRLLRTASVGFVAGLAPYQRPAGAPVTKEFAQNARWHAQFMSGISEPIPPSTSGVMDSQGAWYTPFNHPGMPGYYDLRNWHHNARNSDNAGQ
jgi:hypothetical protein